MPAKILCRWWTLSHDELDWPGGFFLTPAQTAESLSPLVTNKQEQFPPLTKNNSLLQRNPNYQNTETKTNGDTHKKMLSTQAQ